MLTGLSYFNYPQLFPNIFEIEHVKVIDSQKSKETDIREKITNLVRVLLKKSEIEARAESTSNVKVDLQSAS